MTDLEKLKEVLDNQAERGIKSGDWDELSYEVERDDDYQWLKIQSKSLMVCFSKRGRLIGICNWQE